FRGTISADTYKDFILTMLFLKYISDVWQDHYDEYKKEYGDNPEVIEAMMKSERFVLPEGTSFYALYEKRHEMGNGERIDKALHKIEEENGKKLRDASKSVFQDISFNTDKLGDAKQKNTILRHLLEDFARPEMNLKPSRVGNLDVIGNAYEYLIGKFAAQGGKKAGEFYTPPEVSEVIARLLAPKEGESICDPACGSGSLLLKCSNWIKKHYNSKRYELYGQEAIGSTWSLAKMNMFLHGEDNHKIEWGDTIRSPKLLDKDGNLKLFDIVTANPPFSLDKWGHDEAEHDPHGRFRRGVPPKTKGDYAFITHMIETLKPQSKGSKGGRMGVVVPHGVLFRGSSEGKIRKQLIDENLLDAVIGLPEKLFYGTGIPAAILVFRKDRKNSVIASEAMQSQSRHCEESQSVDAAISKSSPRVLFIDASKHFKAGKNQNQLTEDDISRIIQTYRKYRELLGAEDGNDPIGMDNGTASSKELLKQFEEAMNGEGFDQKTNAGVLVDKYAYIATYEEIKENDYNLNIPRYVDTFEEEEEIDLMAVREERLKLNQELSQLESEMEKYLKELGYGA
ncbi:class I SAM-dependent DNA methyltransferase, partial [Kangiella sp.]|uniref:type I restriction-modification system subunit M n=1 Tax=Kangiella sp. TaxID=1920245 RepID=UPI0019A53AD3